MPQKPLPQPPTLPFKCPQTTPLHQQQFSICLFPEKIRKTIQSISFQSMLNERYQSQSPPSTLHHRRPFRSICLPACFSPMSTHPFDVLESKDDHCGGSRRARNPPPRSPMPEIKGRCMNLISRIGGERVRRRYASADFSYDPSSYALNFEDDASRDDDQILLSARLPTLTSPPFEKPMIGGNRLEEILESEEGVAAAVEKKEKSRADSIVPRRRRRSRHSASASVDFSYEPSSYARNFEDDMDDELIALRRFGGQPASPSRQSLTTEETTASTPAKCSTLRPEIAAFS